MTPSQVVVDMVNDHAVGFWDCDSSPVELLIEYMDWPDVSIDADGTCRFEGKPLEGYRVERFVNFVREHYPEALKGGAA